MTNRPGKNGNERGKSQIKALSNERMERVSDLTLQGYSQTQISTILGVSEPAVKLHADRLLEVWKAKFGGTELENRSQRLSELEYGLRHAFDSYLISRENATETTTTYTPTKCRPCRGTGFTSSESDSKEWCEACEGEGTTMVETVTRKVKGQAGDSSFLKEFRAFLSEMSKLQGLYPDSKGVAPVAIATLNINLEGVPNEKLLEAKSAIERLRLFSEEEDDEDQVIDVEPIDDEEGGEVSQP